MSAGQLDHTFNPAGTPPGTVRTNINNDPINPSDDIAGGLALQSGNLPVVAGLSTDAFGNNPFAAVARYTTGGVLDSSFAISGVFTTPLNGFLAEITGVATQSDGKIVVVGDFISADLGFLPVVFLERLASSGRPDSTFGNGGQVLFPQPNLFFPGTGGLVIESVNVQGNSGNIDVAETLNNSGDVVFAVTRFKPNGNVDMSYGSGGTAIADFGSSFSHAAGIALTDSGRAVVTGTVNDPSGNPSVALAQFKTNGTLDNGFGTGGMSVFVHTAFQASANALAISSGGKILVAGSASSQPNQPVAQVFLLLRFTANGTQDTLFGPSGSGGVVTPNFIDPTFGPNLDAATSVTYDLAGRIVVGGTSAQNLPPPPPGQSQANGLISIGLARYTANGTLDTSFGPGGKVLTSFPNPQPLGQAVTSPVSLGIDVNDKIVVATSIGLIPPAGGNQPPHAFLVARYLSDNGQNINQRGNPSTILTPPSPGGTVSVGTSGVSSTVTARSGAVASDGQATPLALDQLFASLVGQTSAKSDPSDADGSLFDPFSV
jgi:uncharacterized delta-60 repeat protein